MQTIDTATVLVSGAMFLLGIFIGCLYMEQIYKRDINELVNQIKDIEKELSK